MRVTGGTGRGKRLRVPAGDRVRPTSDKVKQALFNILGDRVTGTAFLDLFAGAGGVGIEALSRGASRVVFVDDDRKSLKVIRLNVEDSGFGDRAEVIAAKAESFIRKSEERFAVIFLDPPYSLEIRPLLEQIADSDLLEPDAVVVAEHFKKQSSPAQAGMLTRYREAVYGDTVLAFYKKETGGKG
ncbi:MAG: 16S rRNA (guanine(966)-N(2))-methyltransferase RsmD [Nitrospirota bacterium]|nr:16S rRNA (guanine(966)-N(2))-methyltransferase RsmD [Nitrospirota bacterium]